jgi:hypothetical protein
VVIDPSFSIDKPTGHCLFGFFWAFPGKLKAKKRSVLFSKAPTGQQGFFDVFQRSCTVEPARCQKMMRVLLSNNWSLCKYGFRPRKFAKTRYV